MRWSCSPSVTPAASSAPVSHAREPFLISSPDRHDPSGRLHNTAIRSIGSVENGPIGTASRRYGDALDDGCCMPSRLISRNGPQQGALGGTLGALGGTASGGDHVVPRNERLAALMTEAGFLDRAGTIGRKRFARAVNESPSARRAGRSYSHTYVSRWLDGVIPRDDDTRNAIREALGDPPRPRRRARRAGLPRHGPVHPTPASPTPRTPEDSTATVAQLFDADLAGA